MQHFVPRFDTIFFDVKQISDEEIMNIQNLAIATFLLSQKHINDLDGLVEKVLKIIESLQNYEERNSLASTLVYIKLQVAKATAKQKDKSINPLNIKFMEVVEELFSDIKKRVKAEGKAEGIEEKVIEVIINGHKKGLDIPILANITQLTEERVIEILNEYGLM